MRWLALRSNPARDGSQLNWVQFALDRPVIHTPGSAFVYCGPDMHLLSAILQKATGTSVLEFDVRTYFHQWVFTKCFGQPIHKVSVLVQVTCACYQRIWRNWVFYTFIKVFGLIRRSSPQDGWSSTFNPREKQMEILTVTGGGQITEIMATNFIPKAWAGSEFLSFPG